MAQYKVAGIDKLPHVVIFTAERNLKSAEDQYKRNLTKAKKKHHNSKMIILKYTDGSMRVVVMTANLFKDDWDTRVQGLWISDKLPTLGATSKDGESPTGFRDELMKYLESYNMKELKTTISYMYRVDFSSVKVHLVTSRPWEPKKDIYDDPIWDANAEMRYVRELRTRYADEDEDDNGSGSDDDRNMTRPMNDDEDQEEGEYLGNGLSHDKILDIFSVNKSKAPENLPLVIQCANLEDFYYNESATKNYFLETADSFDRKSVKFIYPSKKTIAESNVKLDGAGVYCDFSYPKTHYDYQKKFLDEITHDWKSDSRFCTKAIPNIRTYSCFDSEKLYWFFLSTYDATKSAWGEDDPKSNSIKNYQVGVVFLPRPLIGADHFPLKAKKNSKCPVFKLPFDVDMKAYVAGSDEPFKADQRTRKF